MPETIKVLVEGGKATPAPPLGPTLAQLKIDVDQIITKINEKTKDFAGMQVPVEITIKSDKSFDIKVGTPPVSELIKKELNLKKLAKTPWKEPVPKEGEEKAEPFSASLSFEQVLKIAKAKIDALGTRNLKAAVKQVVANCVSCGVLVEGKSPKEIIRDINNGKFDEKISK